MWQYTQRMYIIYRTNYDLSIAGCCCKETPPMAGWNLGYFTRTIQEISRVVFLSVYAFIIKHMLYESRASVASAQGYVVRTGLHQVLRAYIAWQSFLENNFADFLYKAWVKVIPISSSCWWRFVTATSAMDQFYWSDQIEIGPCHSKRKLEMSNVYILQDCNAGHQKFVQGKDPFWIKDN